MPAKLRVFLAASPTKAVCPVTREKQFSAFE
jgi:hypothetical protein